MALKQWWGGIKQRMASDWSDPEVRTGEVTVEAERVRGRQERGRKGDREGSNFQQHPTNCCSFSAMPIRK